MVDEGSVTVKRGLAQMLKGGVIMDVVNPEEAKIAEEAGAVAVMALERVPSDIRTEGEAGTGNIVEAVRHQRAVMDGIRRLTILPHEELMAEAKNLGAPYELVVEVAKTGKLPVVNFAAGGVATPADAALMMQLGSDGVFVGSGIFKSKNPQARAKAIVQAVAY